jgi:hypothetical protein
MTATYYRLRRLDPGKEMLAEGRRIEEVWQDETGSMRRRDIAGAPQIGRCFRIAFVDTYCELTWWGTTPVQEILEDNVARVVFRTQKSVYELLTLTVS